MKKALVAALLAVSVSLSAAAPAAAASPLQFMGACAGGVADVIGLQSWDACLQHDANGVPQLKALSDIWLIAFPVIEDAIKIGGYVAAGFIIWAGVKYLKSQGDPGQVNEARQIIHNAVIGLILTLISVAIVQFVAGRFTSS